MSHTTQDILDPARAAALQLALGEEATISNGTPLPPFFHQLYFWQPAPPEALGRDGHPKTGALIPDVGLPRRMWAGGQLRFHAPLLAGSSATKTTALERVTHKQGRSGPLAFVTLKHEIQQGGQLCITELQDLVYREDGKASTAPIAPTNESTREAIHLNSTHLFRYSALTFNGHRIHYDADYAREVESYNGLVVHGPLLAHLLMRMATRQLGRLKHFSFRATAPLIVGQAATLCWLDGQLWVRGRKGQLHMRAEAG